MNTNIKLDQNFLQNQIIQPLNRESIKGLFTFYKEQEQIQQYIKQQKCEKILVQKADKLRKHSNKLKSSHEDSNEKKLKRKKSKRNKIQLSSSRVQGHQSKSKSKRKRKLHINQQQKIQAQLKAKQIQSSSKTLPIKIQSIEDVADKFLKRIKQRKLTRSINLTTQKQTLEKQAVSNIANLVQDNLDSPQKCNFYKLLYPKENQKINHDQKYVNEQVIKNKLCLSVDLKKRIKIIIQIQKNEKNRNMLIQEIIQKHAISLRKKKPKSRKRLYTQIPANILSQVNHNLDMKLHVRNNFYTHQKNSNNQQIQTLIDNLSQQQQQQWNPISPPSVRCDKTQRQLSCEEKREKGNEHQLKFPKIKKQKLVQKFSKIKSVSCSKQKILRQHDHSRCKRCQQKILLAQIPKRQKSPRNKTESLNQQRNQLAFIQLGVLDTRDFHLNNSLWQDRKNLLLKKLGLKI